MLKDTELYSEARIALDVMADDAEEFASTGLGVMGMAIEPKRLAILQCLVLTRIALALEKIAEKQ